MAQVHVYNPNVRVRIYSSTDGVIDVTQDDVLRVVTKRTIGQPAGQWDLLLVWRRQNGKTLVDRVQPNDYVEIELARVPSAGGALTIAMRGLVDNVRETFDVTMRRITINGRDLGKVLLITQIYYLPEYDPTTSLVPGAQLDFAYDIPGGVIPQPEFVQLIYEKIVTPNIVTLQAENAAIPSLTPRVDVPDRFVVSGFSIQPYTGSVYTLFDQYASKPWIENFVDDDPNGPVHVYRWTPLRDYTTGKLLSSDAKPARRFVVSVGDIISTSLGKSDNEVFTYFFTYPQYAYLERIAFKQVGTKSGRNPYLDPGKLNRYGFRPLELSTLLMPFEPLSAEQAPSPDGTPYDLVEQAADLNMWLVAANRDNDKFLNGTITIKGGGGIGIGCDLLVTEWGMEFYIEGVEQTFDIQQAMFTTSLSVTRGRPSTSTPASSDLTPQQRPGGVPVIGL